MISLLLQSANSLTQSLESLNTCLADYTTGIRSMWLMEAVKVFKIPKTPDSQGRVQSGDQWWLGPS